MSNEHATPIVIRNQRVRGPVAWMWIVGFCVAWAPLGVFAGQLTPREWDWVAAPVLLLVWLVSFVGLIAWLSRNPRVSRVKLSNEMRVYGVRRLNPAQVTAFRLVPDPDEDYAESNLPVPMGLIEIERRRGITVRMVISVGDAHRLQRWAERKGIAFNDPNHLLTDAGRRANSGE